MTTRVVLMPYVFCRCLLVWLLTRLLSDFLNVCSYTFVIHIRIWALGYSDFDVFLENDEGSGVYRCKKLF
jgi:hypothetical protein